MFTDGIRVNAYHLLLCSSSLFSGDREILSDDELPTYHDVNWLDGGYVFQFEFDGVRFALRLSTHLPSFCRGNTEIR